MFFEHVSEKINVIESFIGGELGLGLEQRPEIFRQLRLFGLSDFAEVLFGLPLENYPNLSRVLPRMASEDVQRAWTGTAGKTLLGQSIDAARTISYNFANLTGRSLDGAKILDFGCGYGRLTRLMYYYSDEKDVFGIDPWEKSIEICNRDGLNQNFLVSDYLPDTLPVPNGMKFDLIFAFSVFTHLSIHATKRCLDTLSHYLKADGVIAITFRPIEYWDIHFINGSQYEKERLKCLHRDKGFAFKPHNREPINGDITYGDTSLSVEWLRTEVPTLKVHGIDRSLGDPYQVYAFLGYSDKTHV